MLCLAALNPAVRKVVERSSLGATIGCGRMFLTLERAVAWCRALLEKAAGP